MMNKSAIGSILGVDLILFVVDATRWTREDDHVVSAIAKYDIPVYLILNKVDLISDKSQLLPLIDSLKEKLNFVDVFPVSATRGDNVPELKTQLVKHLPLNPPFYDSSQLTDRGLRFMVSELIREKVFIYCHQELPYVTTVEIESIENKKGVTTIHALIWVERDGQKKIIIGKDGVNLKRIGSEARVEIEQWLDKKVFLQLWVKVKSGWSDDERALRSFGYSDNE
jgi:GTP-binding protein Era